MKKEIFTRKYYAGFGDTVTEKYYEENGEFFQHTLVTGYRSKDENLKKITKEDIEKVIRIKQDILINELSQLNNKIQELKRL